MPMILPIQSQTAFSSACDRLPISGLRRRGRWLAKCTNQEKAQPRRIQAALRLLCAATAELKAQNALYPAQNVV